MAFDLRCATVSFLHRVLIWNPNVFSFFFLIKKHLVFLFSAYMLKTTVQSPRIYSVNVYSCSN